MSRMEDNFIDLTITSPPYNLGKKHHTGSNNFDAYDVYSDDMPETEYQQWQIKVLNEIYRATKAGGSLMYNHKNRIRDGKQISVYEWILNTNWVIKQELVWFNGSQNFDKCRFYPMTERVFWLSKGVDTDFNNNINQHDLIKDNSVGVGVEHKRSFPIKLAQRFILCFENAEIIYDPFMGSGTTAIASVKEKRKWIGSEISKEYVDLAYRRLEPYLTQKTLF